LDLGNRSPVEHPTSASDGIGSSRAAVIEAPERSKEGSIQPFAAE
jgi:hypothetical protein